MEGVGGLVKMERVGLNNRVEIDCYLEWWDCAGREYNNMALLGCLVNEGSVL